MDTISGLLTTGFAWFHTGPRLVCGHRLWVAGMHLPAGAYLIVVSNRPAQQALEVYKRRWHIEVLFEALKSRGFNFTL